MNTNHSDGTFGEFLQDFLNGLRSVEDLLAHAKFKRLMREFSHSYYCNAPGWVFGPDDLHSTALTKVWLTVGRLSLENTPNESAFTTWLRTLVRNTFLDEVRKHNRRQGAFEQIEVQIEELVISAPGENPEAKFFLSLFLEFIEAYAEPRRKALELWLQSYSLREIADEVVDGNGNAISHVAICHWVNATLADFRKSMGLPSQPKYAGQRVIKRMI